MANNSAGPYPPSSAPGGKPSQPGGYPFPTQRPAMYSGKAIKLLFIRKKVLTDYKILGQSGGAPWQNRYPGPGYGSSQGPPPVSGASSGSWGPMNGPRHAGPPGSWGAPYSSTSSWGPMKPGQPQPPPGMRPPYRHPGTMPMRPDHGPMPPRPVSIR